MFHFYDLVSKNPIISSVENLDNLSMALDSPTEIIFLLDGNIFNLKDLSSRIMDHNKALYINIDCIDGFAKDTWGLDYIIKNISPNGIISSKTHLIKQSKDMGVFSIQRFLVYDSYSLKQAINSIKKLRPSAVEILPGIIPKTIHRIIKETKISVIASGLITDNNEISLSLEAGATAISSSDKDIWYID